MELESKPVCFLFFSHNLKDFYCEYIVKKVNYYYHHYPSDFVGSDPLTEI
jgi:hypothetical protein